MSLNFEEIVNSRVGLIKSLEEVSFRTMPKQYFRYLAKINQNIVEKDFPGLGFALDSHIAKTKAIGEAIERYCSTMVDTRSIIEEYEKNLEQKYVSPLKFNRFTDEQYKKNSNSKKYNPYEKRQWIKSIHVNNNTETLLPIETVYLNRPTHYPFRDLISTGLACGPSLDFAFEGGLMECIERDAFMLFWLLGCINHELNIEEINNKEIVNLKKLITNQGISLRVFDISQMEFKVYTILTLLQVRGKKGFYMATSSNRNLERAILRAMEEGTTGYHTIKERIEFYDIKPPEKAEDINSLEQHAPYYVQGNNDAILDYLLPSTLPIKKIGKNKIFDYKEMIESVLNFTDCYYCDITSSDVKEIGLKVLRVVLPELIFLPSGEPFLESDRLEEKKKRSKFKDINLEPHPFP